MSELEELDTDQLRMMCAAMLISHYTKEDFLTNRVNAGCIVSRIKKSIPMDKDEEKLMLTVVRESIYTFLVELPDQTEERIDA